MVSSKKKKDDLKKYREAKAESDRLRGEIAALYSAAERMTTVLKMVPGGGGGGRKIENAIEGIDELAARLGEKQNEAITLRRSIENSISKVSDGRLRILLEYRYIDGMTWDCIADKMGFEDVRWVYRLHGKALSCLTIESHV